MNRRVLARVAVAVACLSAALPASASGPSARVSYSTQDVTLGSSGEWTTVELRELGRISRAGEPELPVETVRFVIPSGTTVRDVVVRSLEEEVLPGRHRVLPTRVEAPIGEERRRAVPDPSVYESDRAFPAERVVFMDEGSLGGYRIATVGIYPLTYEPRLGRLTLATEVAIDLVLGQGGEESIPRLRVTRRSHDLYRRMVESLVVNPDDVPGAQGPVEIVDELGPEGFLPRHTPSLGGSPVDYVIVTSDALEPYFADLADWKTTKGLPAVVKTISWIEANYPGACDTAERIRLFLQDAYSSWGTSYVLLGGDTNIVPARIVWTDYSEGEEIVTDLYYSDLDGNWNEDGDSVFGEGYAGAGDPGDGVDLYPDLFVGRAPVADIVEAAVFCSKTLAYEQDSVPAFCRRNLYLAEVLFPYDWEPGQEYSTDGAEDIVEPTMSLVPGHIEKVKLYQNYTIFPDSYPLDRPTAIDSLNLGYNIISHVGHANKDVLRVSKNNYISMLDADGLLNGETKSGLIWLLNCTATAIDYDCVAERLMNNPDGGTAMVFGSTGLAFPATAKDYYEQWFSDLYVSRVRQAGVLCSGCKIPFIGESNYDNTDRWTQMAYVYLGDPEQHIWTTRPFDLIVDHDSSIPLGETTLTVTVTDPAPIHGALVSLDKEGEVYVQDLTSISGEAYLTFTPQKTGTMSITVTADNHLPYEGTISVTSTTGAHVTLRSFDVSDDAVGDSDGNGNTLPEAGETVELGLVVGNGGQATAADLTATFISSDAYVDILDGTEDLGTLAPGSPVSYDTVFVLAIADSTPNEHEVAFEIEFTTPSRDSWTAEGTLRILRPIPMHYLHDIVDRPGGDGVADIGDTVLLTITLLNEGNGDADGVSGVLRQLSPAVTVFDSTDVWGDIDASDLSVGQTGFEFVVNSEIASQFALEITDEDGKVWTSGFDVSRPAAPESLYAHVQATTVYLTWNPVTDGDVRGYSVYRSLYELGPFVPANERVVEGTAYYADGGLDENRLYYYRVTAIDESGNESLPSETIWISTNPPSQPGWPLQAGETIHGTPVVGDIDLDGDAEVLVGAGDVYCWHHNGIEFLDGDGDPRTNGIYAIHGTGGYRSSLAIGELDGDAYPEIVGAAWADVGTARAPAYEVFAWNAEDGKVLFGFPVTTANFCWATPTLADLDHDGLCEIALPCANGLLYCWRGDGTEFIDGDNDTTTVGVFADLMESWAYGSPAAADIDNDNDIELIVPSRSDSVYAFNPDGSRVPGWPVDLNGKVVGSVAVGDVDGDGDLEVAAATLSNKCWLLDSTGAVMSGWPKDVQQGGDFPPSPTFADLDGNGDLEIIQAGSDGTVSIWTWLGGGVTGWPRSLGGACHSSPSVGDVDGDPGLEIVIGCDDGLVYGFNVDGSDLPGWPIQTDGEIYASPSLDDLDGDGDIEVVAGGFDQYVYVWDCDGDYDDGDGVEWATFRHDFARTALYGYTTPVGVPEEGGVPVATLRLERNVPNPFNPTTTVSFEVPGPGAEIDLSIYNIRGELVATLAEGPYPAGRHSAVWDGRDRTGARVASGVYFVRLSSGAVSRTGKMVLLK